MTGVYKVIRDDGGGFENPVRPEYYYSALYLPFSTEIVKITTKKSYLRGFLYFYKFL